MESTVEMRFDPASRMWTADVDGRSFSARTARMLRGELMRALGAGPIEVRVAFDGDTERRLEAIVAKGRAYKVARQRLDVTLDNLNVERQAVAEQLLECRCSIEQVASRLEMHPTSLAHLVDSRAYSGRRAKALRERVIKPGERASRGKAAGSVSAEPATLGDTAEERHPPG